MSDLDDMALFAAVAKANGFSRASENIGVPVATLSRRIAALEEQLGWSLLKRTTRSMQLTEAGKIYLGYCESVVTQAALAKQALIELREEPAGHLIVMASFGADIRWGSRLLADFMQRYSKISLDALLLEDNYNLDTLNFDIAFVHGEKPVTHHAVQGIGVSELMLCASSGYLARKGIPASVDALEDHDLLSCSRFRTHETMPEELQSCFEKARLACNDPLVARQVAMDGCGIAWLPEVLIERYLETGELVRILPACTLSLPVWLVLPRIGKSTKKMEALLQLFFSEAMRSAPWNFPSEQ